MMVISAAASPSLSWRESFDHNQEGWATGNTEDYFYRIEQGEYRITGKKAGRWLSKEFPIRRSSDYSLRVRLKSDSKNEEDWYGVIWDHLDSKNYMEFLVTPKGLFAIIEIHDGKATRTAGWSRSSAVLADGQFNTLEIRHEGQKLVFSVNGTAVKDMPYASLGGKNIGFTFNSAQTISVDSILLFEERTPAGESIDIGKGGTLKFESSFGKESSRFTSNSRIQSSREALGMQGAEKFVLTHTTDESTDIATEDLPFDFSRNFSIAAEIEWLSGQDDNSFGLAVDHVENNLLLFVISANGYFKIARIDRGKWTDLVEWTESPNLATYEAANILSIHRRGNRLLFAINRRVVHEIPWQEWKSTRVGFGSGGAMKFAPRRLQIFEGPWTSGPLAGTCTSGYGVYGYRDGSRYAGFWERSLPNGYGTRYGRDGKIEEGIWKDGVFTGIPADEEPKFFPVVNTANRYELVDSSGKSGPKPSFALRQALGLAEIISGYRIFVEDGNYGFIDDSGIAQRPGTWAQLSGFSGGYAIFKDDSGGVGIINVKGETVVAPAGKGEPAIVPWAGLSRGIARTELKDGSRTLYGLTSVDGLVLRKPDLLKIGDFCNGLAYAQTTEGRYGYLDRSGAWSIPPRYANASDFSEGLARVVTDAFTDTEAIIDTGGRIQFTLDFDKTLVEPRKFSDGLILFRDGEERYGYLDRSGNVVIPAHEWGEPRPFSEGLAAVHEIREWHYVDRSGATVIKGPFEDARQFGQGLAAAKKDGLWGYIDTKGNWAIPPGFVSIFDFDPAGLAQVLMPDGFWTWIDKSGRPIWTDGALLESAFIEEFLNNDKGWPVGENQELKIELSGGMYTVTAKQPTGTIQPISLEFERSKDFALSAKVRYAGQGTQENIGLAWDLRDLGNFYVFAASPLGAYSILRYRDGTPTLLVPWTRHDAVKTGSASNLLLVRKKGETLEFSVNDRLVKSIPSETVQGKWIGFVCFGKTALSLDRLELRLEKH